MKKIISTLFALIFSIFFSLNTVDAIESGNQSNNFVNKDSEIDEIQSESNENFKISKYSEEDLFGDEQAFPFIAGLGKNAAH